MSCTDNTCGVGGWNGPLPGDPDNNVTLHARTVYGGINVNWSTPNVNGFAVAHTRIFRGTTDDFTKAVELGTVGGTIYFDRLDPPVATTYYYWIQIVSVNGTVNDRIGPVSAIAEKLATQTLESLTGMIDAGVLAQSLKTDIAGITTLNSALYQEIRDRFAANAELAALLDDVRNGVVDSMTYINLEVTQRKDANSAFLQQLLTLVAAVQEATAAIFEEKTVRADQFGALSQRVTDIFAEFDGDLGLVNAAIRREETARATADEAMAQDIETLAATLGDGNAGVVHDLQAVVTKTNAIASDVTTVESAMFGNVATGQVGLTTKVETIDGVVTEIGSLYTAKVQVNGLIGGFGVYNNGSIVEAGFDVDRFWVGRTGPDQVKPFIIDNGIVYMDKARIRDADIDSLKLAGSAVTVPISVRSNVITKGTGQNQWKTISRGYIKLNVSGIVYAHCICSQRYGQGIRYWSMRISINGQYGSTVGGQSVLDTPVIAQSIGLPAGTYPVVVEWWGENEGVYIENTEMFIMGAKR